MFKDNQYNIIDAVENRHAYLSFGLPSGSVVSKMKVLVPHSFPTLCKLMNCVQILYHLSHQGSPSGKEYTCSARDLGLIPGPGRFLGGRNGTPFQYSCLGNPMHRGAWRVTVHGVKKSQT